MVRKSDQPIYTPLLFFLIKTVNLKEEENVKRTRIAYWEKWGGEEWEAMANIVHSFNESQENYEVIMTSAGDWSSSPDLPRFLRALKKGTPPDIIGLEDRQIVDLAIQGALQSLHELIEPKQISQVNFSDDFLSLCKCNKDLYGVPVSADIVTLYINLDSVQETRFEKGMPAELWEFDAGLDEVISRGKIGFVPTYPGWWPHAWAWFFGGSWFDEQGRFTPDNPSNIRAYEWISSLRNRENLNAFSTPVNPIGVIDPDPFFTGKVAMVFEGDWLVRQLLHVTDLKWMPAAFPTVSKKPAALIVADVLSIPKGAKHLEGAAAFIRYAMQPKQIEQLAIGQGKITPLKHWSQNFLSSHRNPHLKTLQEILSSAQLFYDPRISGWMAYLDQIKQAFANIWSGKQVPSQALNAIKET
jgi:ABC-type glycerol-3-phosphate transport system substrate-binding protein